MIKVMAFGTFDILHPGHKHYLMEAKSKGDYLKVVVARDTTVEEVKGRLPANNQEKRLEAVRNLEFVDEAVLGETADKLAVVKNFQPDVICIGYDQESFVPLLKKLDYEPRIIRISSYEPSKYKSSLLSSRG